MVAKRNWKHEPKGQRTIRKSPKCIIVKFLHFVKRFLTWGVSMLRINHFQYPNKSSVSFLRTSYLGLWQRVTSHLNCQGGCWSSILAHFFFLKTEPVICTDAALFILTRSTAETSNVPSREIHFHSNQNSGSSSSPSPQRGWGVALPHYGINPLDPRVWQKTSPHVP